MKNSTHSNLLSQRKKKAYPFAAASALLLAMSAPAVMAEHMTPGHVYLSIHAGIADTDVDEGDVQNRLNDDGIAATANDLDADRNGFGIGLGYQLTERWAVELDYLDLDEVDIDFTAPAVFNGLDDVHPESGDGFTLSALYRYPLSEKWSLRARVGVFDWEGDYSANTTGGRVSASDDGTDLYWGLGAGYEINHNWSVNAEYQMFDFDRDESSYLRLGLVWRFGGGEKPAVAVIAPAPAPEPVPTPTPEPVVAEQAAEEVCKLFDGSLDDAQFEFASAELTGQAKENLSSAVSALKKFPKLNLEVQAHTDSVGRDAANQLLSERRAQSVMEYFISQGIAAARLSSAGFGETQPIADNNTDAGRALNRRVDLKPVDQGTCQ